MSDDLRRVYLSGYAPSLYGNLPGDDPDHLDGRNATFPGLQDTQNAQTHAFAAMPRPYDQHNDQWNTPRDFNRAPNYSNRSLKYDGTLNLQNKDWSGTTYMLAPCPRQTDSKDTKSMVLEHAIESIRTTGGKWKNKTDCLVNHFNQGLILTSATLTIEDFNRYESMVYDYTYVGIQTAGLRAINIPATAAAEPNFRSSARYVITEMTVNPRRRFSIPGKPGNYLLPGPDTKTVMFRLPQGPDGHLHEDIPLNVLRNMRQLLNVSQYLQETHQFGMAERDQFSQDKFTHWIQDLREHTKYEVVARLIRPAFVGEGIIETPVNRLVQCQQRSTNDKGQMIASTILEHYARFTAIVQQQLNPETPFPIHLPTTFFNSLTPHMQDKLNRRHYRLPGPGSNQEQLHQLLLLRDIAVEEEHEIETQIQLIKTTLQPATGGQRSNYTGYNSGKPAPRPTTRAFMAHAEYGSEDNTHTEDRDSDPLMEQYRLIVACFMSPAESALRSASGTRSPIECWGCTGHSMYHNSRFHSFRDCPNKYDKDVRTMAFKRMKEMREEFETRKMGAETAESGKRKKDDTGTALIAKADAMREWRELGFQNKREAERAADAAALMATDISDRNRQHLVRAYNRKWTQGGNGATNEPTEAHHNYYGPQREGEGAPNAYNFIVRVFQAVPVTRIPLEISPTLPHTHFPIGEQHGRGKLLVALDSCAGINIGHLGFHKAMAEIFPEMVTSLKTMEDYGENDITIGGVEVSAKSLKITHIIEYRTPYRYNGAPCNLTFGLSEHAAATAILSINFLRKTKALWSYDDSEPSIHLTIWNSTLKVHYEPPSRRPSPTPQARFRNETTAVYTATSTLDITSE